MHNATNRPTSIHNRTTKHEILATTVATTVTTIRPLPPHLSHLLHIIHRQINHVNRFNWARNFVMSQQVPERFFGGCMLPFPRVGKGARLNQILNLHYS